MKTGAGCIVIAKSTGRILLSKRGNGVKFPGTWSTWGGWLNRNESPIVGARRELFEETRFDGDGEMLELFQYKNYDFEYHNFVFIINEEFTPVLNWETQDFMWVNLDSIPNPLHFGLRSLLKNKSSFLEDLLKKFI